jgi:hypothetical protein
MKRIKRYHVKELMPDKVKRMMYIALDESVMRYGLQGWGFASDVNLGRISCVRKKILCLISKPQRNISYEHLLK